MKESNHLNNHDMFDLTQIYRECPNAVMEWQKTGKKEVELMGDGNGLASVWTDQDIMLLPLYFDKLGIFIHTQVYWGSNNDNHSVEISIRNQPSIVYTQSGQWSENLSHKAFIHRDRAYATAAGVKKAFRIRQSQIKEEILFHTNPKELDLSNIQYHGHK